MRFVYALMILVVVLVAAVYFLVYWPIRDPHPVQTKAAGVLAIRGAKIYVSPDAPVIEQGTVVVRDGVIAAVGPDVVVPAEARVLACQGCVVTAGFWNSHVHFTEPNWQWAAWKPAGVLNAQLADMLTSRGFTTVVDLGSDPRDTFSLRRRIESGELAGPKIYTAGMPQYPPHGIPYYLKDLPWYIRMIMAQPDTPEQAAQIEERNIARGADLLKLFTGSWVARGKVKPMPEANARAAVEVAHRHGQLAFAHPSNLAGTKVAIESGVDVLAHAPDDTEGITEQLFRDMVSRHMAMIPTLKMFGTTVTTKDSYLKPIYAEVREFHELGGQLMFGTDVGYMTDYTTQDEFRALGESGLGPMDVLRMLTSAPAQRFKVTGRKGAVEVGRDGDLVVLGADPAQDIAAFSRVLYAVRAGRVIYAAP